jgi:hypothetical protein
MHLKEPLGEWVKWNLISVYLEICNIGARFAQRTIGSENHFGRTQ